MIHCKRLAAVHVVTQLPEQDYELPSPRVRTEKLFLLHNLFFPRNLFFHRNLVIPPNCLFTHSHLHSIPSIVPARYTFIAFASHKITRCTVLSQVYTMAPPTGQGGRWRPRGPNYERNQENRRRKQAAKARNRANESAPTATAASEHHVTPDPPASSEPLAASDSTPGQKSDKPRPILASDSRPLFDKWQNCLIHVNGEMLQGYSNDSIRRVGEGFAGGLVTEARCDYGPFISPSISFRTWIRDGHKGPTVISADLYLEDFLDVAEVEVVKTSDAKRLATLFPDQNTDVSDLAGGRLPKDHEKVFNDFAASVERDDLTSAEQIPAFADEILRVSFAVNATDAALVKNQTFFDEANLHQESKLAIGQSVRDVFENASPILHITLSMAVRRPKPYEALNKELIHWSGIQMHVADVNPFREILSETRFGADDLTFDNVNTNVPLPPKPLPGVKVFSSKAHRTVSTIYGTVEEFEFQDEMAERLWNTRASAIAMPDPASKWQPTPYDMHEYGILADGTYTGHYVFIEQTGIGELLPQMGQKVAMYLHVPHTQRPIPTSTALPTSHICKVGDSIFKVLDDAHEKGQDAQDNLKRQLEKLNESKNPRYDKIADIEAKLENVADRTRRDKAAEFLFGLVTEVDEATRAEYPKWDILTCRYHIATLWADELQRQHEEDDLSWIHRLRLWVKHHSIVMPVHVDSVLGDPFEATRLPLPAGVAADLALFYIQTPLQPNWTPGRRLPPAAYEIPHTQVLGSLQSFLPRMFADDKVKKNVFLVKILYHPSDATAKAECAAITALNALKSGTAANAWWTHTVNFRQFDEQYERNLLEAFPALQTRLDQDEYHGEEKEAISSLKKTKAGRVMITGCPGAGKTTLAVNICDAVVAQPPGKGWRATESGVAAEVGEKEIDILERIEELEKVERAVLAADDEPSSEAWPHITQSARAQVVELHNLRRQRYRDEARKAREQARNQAQYFDTSGAPSAGDSTNAPASSQLVYRSPTVWTDEELTAGQGEQTLRNGRVAWTAPSNVLVKDAVERIKVACKGKTVAHVFTYQTELANLLQAGPSPPEVPGDLGKMSRVDQQLARHHHAIRVTRYNTTPSAVTDSLSEQAKKRAQSDPAKYAAFLRGLRCREEDPEAPIRDFKDFKQAGRELLVDTALDCDVIVSTPVALAQFANYCAKWVPDLIVVDEVGRLTEAAALIPTSKYPTAACLFVGDPRQSGPFITTQGHDVRHLFGKQRQVTLIERALFSDQVDITLRKNRRCHDTAGEWCRDEYYNTTMSIHYGRSQSTKKVREYLQRFTSKALETANLWIEVEGSKECQIGTSFVNPIQARFVVELVAQIISNGPLVNMQDVLRFKSDPSHRIRKGSVMILAAYAQQKAEYQRLLAELSPAEFPPGMLSVRTIDDSQSQQASLVVIDLVRSEKNAGFINDPARLAVAMSRAALAHIIVGSTSIVPRWGNGDLISLYSYFKSRNALVRVQGKNQNWSKWCTRCLRPGHTNADCTAQLKCTACHAALRKSDHAGRHCPNPVAMSPWYVEELAPIDNVFRDIQAAAQEGAHTKRVKIQESGRRNRARAPSTQQRER